jgi:uncharacterized protein (TIGR02996 family)
MRSFQFSDAKSHKFWNIAVSGDSFTVTFGRVGTAGQTQTKSFPSAEKAQAEADKVIREKVKKGYRETTPKAEVSQSEAFEAGLLDHPDDIARWSAYSDYLTEQGDPRGEFMRVQLALEDETLSAADRKKLKKAEADLLKAHERDWLGPLAEFTVDVEPEDMWVGRERGRENRRSLEYRFEKGWLASLDFVRLTVNQARAYAACKEARLVREVVVSQVEWEDFPVTAEELAETGTGYLPGPDVPDDATDYRGFHALCRCPHLGAVRRLLIGDRVDVTDEGGGQFNSEIGAEFVLPLVRQMPRLEELEVYARDTDMSTLFAMPLPRLKSLVLFHTITSVPLDTLAANKTMTNLATLRFHPHHLVDDEAYIRLKQLRAVCRATNLPNLTHLCLRLTDFGDDGAREIVSSGILKRLRVLDLYGGCVSDEGAEALATCPDFGRLEFVNLRKNALTDKGVQALKATKVNLDVREQHTTTRVEYGYRVTPEYLYDGDFE